MTPKHAGPAPPIGPPTGRSPDPERPDTSVRADSAPSNNRSLVVVSNRLPFTAERRPEGTRFRRSAGGLVAALEPVLATRGRVGGVDRCRPGGRSGGGGRCCPAGCHGRRQL